MPHPTAQIAQPMPRSPTADHLLSGSSGACSPSTPLQASRAMFAHWQQRACEAGVALRAPPPEPTGCCGRGCHGCVWEGYYTAAACWEDDARLQLSGCGTAG